MTAAYGKTTDVIAGRALRGAGNFLASPFGVHPGLFYPGAATAAFGYNKFDFRQQTDDDRASGFNILGTSIGDLISGVRRQIEENFGADAFDGSNSVFKAIADDARKNLKDGMIDQPWWKEAGSIGSWFQGIGQTVATGLDKSGNVFREKDIKSAIDNAFKTMDEGFTTLAREAAAGRLPLSRDVTRESSLLMGDLYEHSAPFRNAVTEKKDLEKINDSLNDQGRLIYGELKQFILDNKDNREALKSIDPNIKILVENMMTADQFTRDISMLTDSNEDGLTDINDALFNIDRYGTILPPGYDGPSPAMKPESLRFAPTPIPPTPQRKPIITGTDRDLLTDMFHTAKGINPELEQIVRNFNAFSRIAPAMGVTAKELERMDTAIKSLQRDFRIESGFGTVADGFNSALEDMRWRVENWAVFAGDA